MLPLMPRMGTKNGGKGENGQSLREENEGKIKEREEGDRKLQRAKREREVYQKNDGVLESRVVENTFTCLFICKYSHACYHKNTQ